MIKLPHEIIGKAVADPEFRKALFEDARAALAAQGVTADDETVAAIEALDVDTVEAMLASAGGALGNAAAM